MISPLRSLARYVSQALPDLEVRWADSGSFARPYALVTTSTPVASVAIGPRNAERRQTFSVIAYPTVGVNAESSWIEAGRVANLIMASITSGIDTSAWREGRGHPLRVPLYNYSGLGLREAATEAQRVGWARVVESPEVEVVGDPSESGALAVVTDLRLAWLESVAVPVNRPTLRAVTAEAAAT